MKKHLRAFIAISIVPQIIMVKLLGHYPEWISHYYSNGIYGYLAKGFRYAFGWIPFSVGDIFYTIAGILILRFFVRHYKTVYKKPLFFLREVFIVISLAYFVFHLFWGMNYYRLPLHEALGIETTYKTEALSEFTSRLIEKTNEIHAQITKNDTLAVKVPYVKKTIFEMTPEAFVQLSHQFPALSYHPKSIKPSLYSILLTYMGYSGYLNPFTNEAQVNGLMPMFKMPTVSCHETAHQIGYAAESEANFIGYLAAVSHPDLYFKYSGYSYGLKYCLHALKQQDAESFTRLYQKLHPGVIKNYVESEQFWNRYDNDAEVIFKNSFDAFLKINNQKKGIRSYAYIVPLLINFHDKHPL